MTDHEVEEEEAVVLAAELVETEPGKELADSENDEPELTDGGVIRHLLAEFIGTFFLTLVMATASGPSAPVFVAASAAVLFLLFGPVSGGHFNPVVTVAFGLLGRIRATLAWIYLFAQFAAGFAGFALAWALRPPLDDGARAALRASVDGVVGARGDQVPWFPSHWPLLILLPALLVMAVLAARGRFSQEPTAGAWIGAAVGATFWLSVSIYPAAALPDVVFNGYASAFRALPVLVFFPLIGAYLGALLYRELLVGHAHDVIEEVAQDEEEDPSQEQDGEELAPVGEYLDEQVAAALAEHEREEDSGQEGAEPVESTSDEPEPVESASDEPEPVGEVLDEHVAEELADDSSSAKDS